MVMYKWIKIFYLYLSESGKTKIWEVQTIDGMSLGEIKWNGPWRCYAYYPDSNGFYEKQCMRDIADFLEEKTNEHKIKPDVR